MKKSMLIGGGVLILAAVVAANLATGRGGVDVTAEEVRRGPITSRVSASGKVYPITEVKINSQVSARVERLRVAEGQRVEKGQVLLELDPTLYRARVNAAEATLRSQRANAEAARAQLRQAEDALRTQEQLAERELGREQELRDARNSRDAAAARLRSAEAQVNQAEANLEQARDDLARTVLRAPMDGVVTALAVEEGEMVLGTQMAMGTQLMAVSDLSAMEVQAEVDETDVVTVEVGQRAEVEVDALPDRVLEGEVTEIANAGVTAGRGTQMEVTNFEVKVVLTEADPRLRPGMSAAVDIVTATRDSALYVPIQAVTARERNQAAAASNSREGPGVPEYEEVVFVVTDERRVERRKVRTGISGTAYIEIVEGLSEGERVVTGPFRVLSRTLTDGDPVTVKESLLETAPGV
ncbi:MAG: efflux RND transporter periplasmic adaptor subunit [bacterium]